MIKNFIFVLSCSFCSSMKIYVLNLLWDCDVFSVSSLVFFSLEMSSLCFENEVTESCKAFDIIKFFVMIFELFCDFSDASMTFLNFFNIFLRVWTRVLRDFTSDFSNSKLIISFSFFDSSRLKRFWWRDWSFFELRCFSRVDSLIDVLKRMNSFAILTIDVMKKWNLSRF